MTNWALVAIYVLLAIELLVSANKHGKSRETSFWVALASAGITLLLVWWAVGWRLI